MRIVLVSLAAPVLVACASDVVVGPDPSGGASTGPGGPGAGRCELQRTVSADTDPEQQATGIVGEDSLIAAGPFFLTDFEGGQAWFAPNGTPCRNQGPSLLPLSAHGIRLFVPAGKKLCAYVDSRYGGFRPY
jgi:hypothetical protein